MLDSGPERSGGSTERSEKPTPNKRAQVGLVCASNAVRKFYEGQIEESNDELAFALALDDPATLEAKLEDMDEEVDAVLVVAEPGMDVSQIPEVVQDVLGEDKPVILEDVPEIAGVALRLATMDPDTTSTYTEVIKPLGFDPGNDAQLAIHATHRAVAERKYW